MNPNVNEQRDNLARTILGASADLILSNRQPRYVEALRHADGILSSDWLARVKEATWDECLDEIEEYEINTQQAREGNPYRAKEEQ